MLNNDDRITSLQMFILTVSALNAIEVLILPRELASTVGPDGWAVLIGGHLLSFGSVFIIVKLGLLYPHDTLAEYAPKILGRFVGVPVVLLAGLFWLLITARILRQFADFIQLILPQTSIETVILTILLVVAYVARHGVEPIARVGEIIFPVFIGLLGLLVIGSMFQLDISNLMPILNSSPKKLAIESIYTAFRLEGQGIILMLLPFMAVPQDAYKAVLGALACNLALRLALFVVTIGIFGVELVKTLVWPVEELTRSLTIGGTVVTRFDSIFTALWVMVAFTAILIFFYLASLVFSRAAKFGESSITVLPLLPVIFLAALIPESIVATEELSNYLSLFIGAYTFFVPPLLLLVSHIRGTHKQKEAGRVSEK